MLSNVTLFHCFNGDVMHSMEGTVTVNTVLGFEIREGTKLMCYCVIHTYVNTKVEI